MTASQTGPREGIRVARGYRPGCIGRITELHAHYYAGQAGFGLPFEARVARELAEFCMRYDAERDGLWLALDRGRIEGSIAIDASAAAREGAHLRWFIVSDRLRGRGIGSLLLSEALAHCSAIGTGRVFLNTFRGLDAARHLYERAGFRLVHEAPGMHWGTRVDEQRFELTPESAGR